MTRDLLRKNMRSCRLWTTRENKMFSLFFLFISDHVRRVKKDAKFFSLPTITTLAAVTTLSTFTTITTLTTMEASTTFDYRLSTMTATRVRIWADPGASGWIFRAVFWWYLSGDRSGMGSRSRSLFSVCPGVIRGQFTRARKNARKRSKTR